MIVANSQPMSDKIGVPSRNTEKTVTAEDKIIQGIMTTGSLLSNTDNPTHAAINMARSAVVSEANASIGQWLNQFGTARVQLNIDNDFHLDGSALDFMLPLYDNSKSIVFTQLSARNKSGQNTFNIGAGARIFQNNWMFGVNTFFDHDLTANNRRIGLGAEAWADYLKLSANSYFSLNNWHQSQDFIDYNARPANGYDLRVEAYLPSYPQLGGKLMVAYDSKGNASNRAVTQLTVTAPHVSVTHSPPIIVDAQNSTFTVSPNSIIANGKITSSLTFTAKDASGQPIRNLSVSFKCDDEAGTRLSAVTENKGVYSATLTGNDSQSGDDYPASLATVSKEVYCMALSFATL
ncbi:inverse autotransporter beta domain-containing protein, partial [Candidatus Regiella insecticola]